MKQLSLILLVLALASATAFAQEQQAVDEEKERRNAALTEFNNRQDALRNTGKQKFIRDRYKETRTYQESIVPLYRGLDDDEVSLLAPAREDLATFNGYLDKEDSGLIKLIADRGCDVSQEVVVSDPHCEKYKMPGAGASYSFRKRMYRVKRLADISFTGKEFDTRGLWKHGILISLGNMPIEDLSKKSSELETLTGFNTKMNQEQAGKLAGHLAKGIEGGGLVYRDRHPVMLDTTYVIRSVAYPGRHWESLNDVEYDEFEFDSRRDILVAFRVVRFEPGESVTILWRKLDDKKAPKLKAE